MAKFTGKKTKHGRPIYVVEDGREYSERQVTVEFDRDEKGIPITNKDGEYKGRWINLPSIIDGGKEMMNRDHLFLIYKRNKFKDILGNKRDLKKLYKSAEEASRASEQHSKSLDKGQTK